MKTGAIVQARTGSTRLPGKVLKDIPPGSGTTVLEHVVDRLGRARTLDMIVIATTTAGADEPIVELARKLGVAEFRGSEPDVLARYHGAAVEHCLDVVVRVTSDCPCVDPEVLDRVVAALGTNDYASNTLERTYPHGLDVEAFTFDALERAHKEAMEGHEREHVTPYLYRSGKFSLANVAAPEGLNRPDIRITLDTPEDYTLLSAVFDFFHEHKGVFGCVDIINLFNEKPWLTLINSTVVQKAMITSREAEIEEAIRLLELQGLVRAADILRGA